MRLCEDFKIVPILASADIVAGTDSDSINMACHHAADFDIVFGPSYAGEAGAVIKVYAGAGAGVKTTALTFAYRYGSAAIGSEDADVLTTEATSAALTCATATFAGRLLHISIDPASCAGAPWLTVEVGSQADAGEMTIVAYLKPRFPSAARISALE